MKLPTHIVESNTVSQGLNVISIWAIILFMSCLLVIGLIFYMFYENISKKRVLLGTVGLIAVVFLAHSITKHVSSLADKTFPIHTAMLQVKQAESAVNSTNTEIATYHVKPNHYGVETVKCDFGETKHVSTVTVSYHKVVTNFITGKTGYIYSVTPHTNILTN